ncbi:uncharacterized protein G2W53_027159 [Senna tora]|uniref:Uncharacterized protein n=1 Tax=Senna tora TaxID=362788 RepID=A0A834WLZ6_9FABA|nr:uncharacterized protein G2W53_027159 [Senna tora]
MQTEPEDPMPSPGEFEDLPIALRKGEVELFFENKLVMGEQSPKSGWSAN